MLSQEKFCFTCGDEMKGEFFLITGFIVVIVLFLIKSSLNFTQIIESKQNLEVGFGKKEFLNIKQGLIKTLDYSYNKNESERIENYLAYVRERLKARATDLNGIALGAYVKDVEENFPSDLNVTIFNFLGENIQILNISFNCSDSSQLFSNIPDNSSIKTNFTFIGKNENCSLNVNLTTPKESNKFSVQIPVEVGKNKFIGFFDLRMKKFVGEFRDKFSKVIETP
jgi:hypothetical protein